MSNFEREKPMPYEVPHFINGQPVTSQGRKLALYNPATGELSGHVAVADQALLDKAVAAAHSAFQPWSSTPPPQRAKILFRYKTLLEQHKEKLAALVTQEHGKTLPEALGSVQRGIDVVDFACGISYHLKGSFAEEVAKEIDCYSLHQPLGVCAGITPFNFPAMIPLWMLSMAIACGNTFILKPSEKDPSCSLLLAELAQEAGVPDGVFNVIHGDKETVEALLIQPDIKAISFVGSSTVAEHVYKTGIANNKRVQAFGGAKNHCVIMPDADVEPLVKLLVESAYGSAGERCMALSVAVIIGDEMADRLIARIRSEVKNLTIGPLVTQQHWER
ncbi:MAG: aldehyde dehydrogenase family protein, partial [Gammaproteobacteria bacterium]